MILPVGAVRVYAAKIVWIGASVVVAIPEKEGPPYLVEAIKNVSPQSDCGEEGTSQGSCCEQGEV